ncbi:hypothetical protein M0805_000953 [Coniferiporia weirii]|nr:hypothetical protein M0805_000953 [Coniferiporia weirii]
MFSRLSEACSQLADLYWGIGGEDESNDKDEDGRRNRPSAPQEPPETTFLPPDVQALSQLSLLVSKCALQTAAGAYGNVLSPLCLYARSSLSLDIEKIVLSLHEADPAFTSQNTCPNGPAEDIYIIPFPTARVCNEPSSSSSDESVEEQKSPAERHLHTRDAVNAPQAMLPQTFPLPTVVITAAPPQSRQMSSCVPVQDTCFGARLTVPSHSALNDVHPPMVASSYPFGPVDFSVRAWLYKHGHWCAIALGLEEQERKGIFSRPVGLRRRTIRKKTASIREIPSCQNVFGRSRRDP